MASARSAANWLFNQGSGKKFPHYTPGPQNRFTDCLRPAQDYSLRKKLPPNTHESVKGGFSHQRNNRKRLDLRHWFSIRWAASEVNELGVAGFFVRLIYSATPLFRTAGFWTRQPCRSKIERAKRKSTYVAPRRLRLSKRSQLFIRTHNETSPVITVCVDDPDCSAYRNLVPD